VNWLALLTAALDDVHGDHDEGCDCYERLRDAVTVGLYRFPEVSHDVEEPPVVGCETLEQYGMRRMFERIQDDIRRDWLADTERLTGLMERMEAVRP
jgi:hypothetical protein